MKRTHLPLNGLRVLDAAARHLSFTRAADELAVTPAAVGQQIRALEDTLGVVLFRRTAKGLELTPEAAAGLPALRTGFLQFEEAVRAMQAQQSSKTLTIAAPRDVMAKWLMARLAAYAAQDEDLRLHLVDADGGVDFSQANIDLAVIWADGPGEHEGIPLDEGVMRRVGQGMAISWPGCPNAEAPIHVGNAGAAIDAALAGMGQALVPGLLLEGMAIMEGERAVESPLRYWLVAPLPQWRQKKVKALVEALTGNSTPTG